MTRIHMSGSVNLFWESLGDGCEIDALSNALRLLNKSYPPKGRGGPRDMKAALARTKARREAEQAAALGA